MDIKRSDDDHIGNCINVGKFKVNIDNSKVKYSEFMRDYFEGENCELAKDITEKVRIL